MILMFGLIIIASASSSATGGARYLLIYYPPWSKTLVPGKGKSVSSHGPSASAVSSADGKKSAGQVCVIARPSRVGRRHGGCEKGRRASLCHRTSHPRRPLSVRMGKSPQGKSVSSHGPSASAEGKSVSSHGPSASAAGIADREKSVGQVCVIARPIRVGR